MKGERGLHTTRKKWEDLWCIIYDSPQQDVQTSIPKTQLEDQHNLPIAVKHGVTSIQLNCFRVAFESFVKFFTFHQVVSLDKEKRQDDGE